MKIAMITKENGILFWVGEADSAKDAIVQAEQDVTWTHDGKSLDEAAENFDFYKLKDHTDVDALDVTLWNDEMIESNIIY